MGTKNNQINVPQAKQAMQQFKIQAASEASCNLQNGYNSHLTSREAGSVTGQAVKNVSPGRISKHPRLVRTAIGHIQSVVYIAEISV